MTYNLVKGVYLVKGAKNSAIYDTRNGKVYSLNSSATSQILDCEIEPDFAKALEELKLLDECRAYQVMGYPENVDPVVNFVWFEITTKCNLSCKHCYIGNGSIVDSSKNLMLHEDWQEMIEQTFAFGLRKCQFIGGEPFLYSNGKNGVLDLCEFARKQGFERIEIFTNAQLISDDVIKRLKELEIRIATSLYSSNPKVHDNITGVKGSQKRTVEAIKKLKDFDIDVRVELVLMSLNQNTLKETLQFFCDLGVKYRDPDPIRPTAFGAEENLSPSFEHLYKYGFHTEPSFYAFEKQFLTNHRFNNCLSNKITITETGDVLPCVFARKRILGNVWEKELSEIILGNEASKVRGLNKNKILVCKDCEFRYVCSDCRPLAGDTYKQNDAFDSYPDPRCTYNPYTAEWEGGRWILEDLNLVYKSFPKEVY